MKTGERSGGDAERDMFSHGEFVQQRLSTGPGLYATDPLGDAAPFDETESDFLPSKCAWKKGWWG